MRNLLLPMALLCALSVQGCTGVGMTMAGVGAGAAANAGVNHTLSGIAYKTFTADIGAVRRATRGALEEMALSISKDEVTDGGRYIEAAARQRTAEIELEALTESATRMRVTVIEDDGFFRDSATSTEIIIQTAHRIDAQLAAH